MNAPKELPAGTMPRLVDIDLCFPSPTNPRTTIDEAADAELTKDIKANGLIQPIVVRKWPVGRLCGALQPSAKCFEVVVGHRRQRCGKAAGLTQIIVIERELTDVQVLCMQISENGKRLDVLPLEQALSYQALMKVAGKTAEETADMLNIGRTSFFNRLKLLQLGEEAKKALATGKINPSLALLLSRVPASLQKKATETVLNGFRGEPMSYRSAKETLDNQFTKRLSDARWQLDDAKLCAKAGSCHACPKRSGNDLVLMADLGKPDICTDTVCFDDKHTAHYLRLKEKAEGAGLKVIKGEDAKKLVPYNDRIRSDEYVDPDETCEEDESDEQRTYRQILGDKVKIVAIVENPNKHGTPIIELASQSAMAQALEKCGFLKEQEKLRKEREAKEVQERQQRASNGKAKETEKERATRLKNEAVAKEADRQVKIANWFRAQLFQKLRLAHGEKQTAAKLVAPGELCSIALNLFRVMNSDYSNWNIGDLMKIWGGTMRDAAGFEKIIRKMDAGALCVFLFDLAFYEDAEELDRWDLEDRVDTPRLTEEANRLGIDHKALRAEAEAQFPAPKAPLNPTPAARAGVKRAPAKKSVKAAPPVAKKLPAQPKAKTNPAPAKPAKETKKPDSAQASPAKGTKDQGQLDLARPALKPARAWPFPTGSRPDSPEAKQ